MTELPTHTADVIVVGGGIAGCAIARELATDHEVILVDKGQIAAGASARAAGIIGLERVYKTEPAISEYAEAFFESYDGTGQFSYTQRAYVSLVQEADAAIYQSEDGLGDDGGSVVFHGPERLRERYPLLKTSGVAGGLEYEVGPGHGWLDPFTFTMTLKDDAEERGATVVTHTPVTGLVTEGGRVTGVEVSDEELRAPTVVVAAGWRTPEFLDGIVGLPVRPYRTQCVVLDPGRDISDLPMGSYAEEHLYWRPELNGDLLVGGWSFAVDEPESASRSADAEFRNHVAEVVPQLFEGMERARFIDGWAGVDAATPDTRPIIDAPDDAPDGLVVATGFHGRGVMTAPVTGAAVRSLVTGEECPVPLGPFRVDRFDSRSTDFEFHSISA